MDMHWNPYQGLFAGGLWELDGQESVYKGGQLIASETEEQIYEALGLKWISPALREVRNGQICHRFEGRAARGPETSLNPHQIRNYDCTL
jgi:hypothetical protein